MLKEDIRNTCFSTSVKVCRTIMCCVKSLIIFAVLCHKATFQPFEQRKTSTIQIEKMGQGIKEIPPGRSHTTALNLAYNHISSLPEYVFHNNSYKALARVELYQNKINEIHVSSFRGLKQLKTVVLSDNNITRLDPYTFKQNTKLEKLDLSRNKINFSRLQVFLVSDSLESLIISQNRIEQIYELTFMGVPSLKNLMLEGNILYIIAPNSFKPLNKLQYLSLANTGVYRLSESMFGNNLPRIVDLEATPLAKRFEPPLKKLTNDAVQNLINFDQYIFISDMPV